MPPESQDSAPIEEQTESSSLTDKIKENRGFLIGVLVAMAFMGLCLVPIFLFFLLRGTGTTFLSGGEPTPFATDVSAVLPLQTPIVQSISDTENNVYILKDNLWLLHFTSVEVFNKLDVKSTYKLKVYG